MIGDPSRVWGGCLEDFVKTVWMCLLAGVGVAHATAPPPPAVPASGLSPGVVHDNTVIVCVHDGLTLGGDGCPATLSGVGVAPVKSGPIQLVRSATKAGVDGSGGGPCDQQQHAVAVGPRVPIHLGRSMTVLPNDNPRYRKLLGEALSIPDPIITTLVRVDLEGDGKEEVLFVLDSHPGQWPMGKKGLSYAVVGVRRIAADGGVETLPLFSHQEQMTGESATDHLRGTLEGVTDLDGDGKLEVVVTDAYYEGSGTAVWRVQAGEVPTALGGTGCGA